MDTELALLVENAKKGDKDAFGEIYKIFLKPIYRYIYFSVGQKQLAEDLCQNVFLRAWRSIDSFSKGSFQAFLYTIARNLVYDWYRKKKELSLEVAGELTYVDEIEERIWKKEEEKLLYEALSKLEDLERQIIVLRYFEDLSIGEVAKVVGKREGAVRVKIHRILNKLKLILEEKDGH